MTRTSDAVSARAKTTPPASVIHVDWTRCDGHGLCHALLPGRIEVDEWGFPILRDANVPAREVLAARRAVAACPALALYLTPTNSTR